MKRLYRSRSNAVLGGVCGGIADYFSIDPTIVRLVWLITVFMGGAGILVYLVAWIIIPPIDRWDDDWEWSTRARRGQPAAREAPDGPSRSDPPAAKPASPELSPRSSPESSPASSLESSPEAARGHRTGGLVLIVVGGFLLLRNFVPELHLGRFWPLLLIGIGLWLVWRAAKGGE